MGRSPEGGTARGSAFKFCPLRPEKNFVESSGQCGMSIDGPLHVRLARAGVDAVQIVALAYRFQLTKPNGWVTIRSWTRS